jgi:hypothetical protein
LSRESFADGSPVSAAVAQDRTLDLVCSVEHAADAVAKTVELAPELLVIDEELAGRAIAAAVEICARMPGLPLVVTHGPESDGPASTSRKSS